MGSLKMTEVDEIKREGNKSFSDQEGSQPSKVLEFRVRTLDNGG